MTTKPPPPGPTEPDPTWEHIELWKAVKKAIFTLPSQFESELVISGVLATDLFAFNSSLGATIEEQVIASLNKLRSVWDPEQKYALYSFERQPQTFPDVVLRASAPDVEPKILMGIELKGWYALAKESEPSFRYKVTPAVCAPADLLVVVPWALSKVISGSPQVFVPYVISARQAAEYRNWYWEHAKVGKGDNSITLSTVATNYPTKSDMISDRPASDSGGNFGRFARTKAMDSYIKELFDDKLAGIPLWAWQRFLSLFTESQTTSDVIRGLDALASGLSTATHITEVQERLREKFREIGDIISTE
ncbi:hypothetical protein AVW15_19585 [Chelatococcus daeguensis]|uniref:hypothetical protein n=1 Tax=Chelatococcus daeguensis TaxID=444444 RepID=UPI0007ABE311|nr:hypothetical protein [Chelatococcus daeguensis]KZE32507.1 hypothetical protein AVW15_19585 [Chelatococcus daeguensis]